MSLVVPLMVVITMLLGVKFTSHIYNNVTLCQQCRVPGANDLSILCKKKNRTFKGQKWRWQLYSRCQTSLENTVCNVLVLLLLLNLWLIQVKASDLLNFYHHHGFSCASAPPFGIILNYMWFVAYASKLGYRTAKQCCDRRHGLNCSLLLLMIFFVLFLAF